MALYGNGPGGNNFNQFPQQPSNQGSFQGFGSSTNFQQSGFPMQNGGGINQMSGPGQWPQQQQQQQQNWFKQQQQYPQATPQNQVQHFTPNSNHPPGNQFMNSSFGGFPQPQQQQQQQNFPSFNQPHQYQTSNPMAQSTPNPFFNNQNLPQQFSNLNMRPTQHPQTSMGNLWSN